MFFLDNSILMLHAVHLALSVLH